MTISNLFFSQIFYPRNDKVNIMSMVAGKRGEVGQAFQKNADLITLHGPSSVNDEAARTASRYNYALVCSSPSSRIFVYRKLAGSKGVICEAIKGDGGSAADVCAVRLVKASRGKSLAVVSVGRDVEELSELAGADKTMVLGIGEDRSFPGFAGLRYNNIKETAKEGSERPAVWASWLKPAALAEMIKVVLPWDGRQVLSDQAILAISSVI
jgi:hypothetical protein